MAKSLFVTSLFVTYLLKLNDLNIKPKDLDIIEDIKAGLYDKVNSKGFCNVF